MNNRERVFCAVVKTLYEKYLETKALDFNALVFTQRELESSFNSLHFGKAFKKSLLNTLIPQLILEFSYRICDEGNPLR